MEPAVPDGMEVAACGDLPRPSSVLGDSSEAAGYLQQPCLRRGRLCFVAEGDVWLAGAPLWQATRLTSLGSCSCPLLSPSAERVAFASSCHGAREVFVLEVGRRRPLERLTALGTDDTLPVAWSSDGRRLYVSSSRPPLGYPAIMEIPVSAHGAAAGPAAVWEHGRVDAEQLSFGPCGHVLVGRGTRDCHAELWKGYLGGRVGSCWLQDEAGGRLRKLELNMEVDEPRAAEADSHAASASQRRVPVHLSGPAWLGERIFFVAELDGCGNLWSCSSAGSDLRQHSFHRDLYARNPSSDGESSIVYQRGGELWRYRTESGKAELLAVQLCAPQVLRLPQFRVATDSLEYCALHPDGHHMAAACRGRVFELALQEGPALELRPPPAEGGGPAPFARVLAMSFTTAGSILLVRESLSTDPSEAQCFLELHPPNPYTSLDMLKEDHFWAAEPPEDPAAAPSGRLPDIWGLEPPRAVALSGEVGLVRDICPSPFEELMVAVTTETLELYIIRLKAKGPPGPGRRLELQEETLVERAVYGPDGIYDLSWSYDGRWLAYVRQETQDLQGPTGVWAFDSQANATSPSSICLTERRFEESSPSFDPAGEYLAFLSKRIIRAVPDEVGSSLGFGAGAQRPFLLLLRKDSRNPLLRRPRAPAMGHDESEEEEAAAEDDDVHGGEGDEDPPALPVDIEADGAAGRIMELPVQAGRYSKLVAVEGGLVYLRQDPSKPLPKNEDDEISGSVFIYRYRKAKEKKVADGVRDFEVSLDCNNILLMLEDWRVRVLSLETAGEPQDEEEDPLEQDENEDSAHAWTVNLDDRISLEVDPSEEWAQIFHETWRAVGNHFYDEAMGGVDWAATRAIYEPLLARLGCRSDLTDLLTEMCGELGASHMSIMGPDEEFPEPEGRSSACSMGFLGADFNWDTTAGGYRVKKAVQGDAWSREAGGPLVRAGVAEGAVLLAVNRQRVGASAPLEKLLANSAGCDVYLTIAGPGMSQGGTAGATAAARAPGGGKKKGKAGKKDAKAKKKAAALPLTQTVRVACGDQESDSFARYRDWVEKNCEEVHAATKGRVGYVHVPNNDGDGYSHFFRYFNVECSREVVVIDIRGNSGGYVSEMLIDRLSRTPLGVIVPRSGRGPPTAYPSQSLRHCRTRPGSARTIVLVVDSWSASDAEVLADSVRALGLGTLVGVRTWGGVLSVGNYDVELVDGGEVCVPSDNLYSLAEDTYALENRGVAPDVQVEIPPDAADMAAAGLDAQLREALAEAERLLTGQIMDIGQLNSRCKTLPRTRPHLRWRLLPGAAESGAAADASG